jgi:hypothetical protein
MGMRENSFLARVGSRGAQLASYLAGETQMITRSKPVDAASVEFTNDRRKNTDEVVNDSMGTVDPADTTDTDPDDDPETGGKGSGPKVAE